MKNQAAVAEQDAGLEACTNRRDGPADIDHKNALILTADGDASTALPSLVAQCGLMPLQLHSIGDLRLGAVDGKTRLVLCEEVLPDGDFRDALRILASTARRIPVVVFSRIADWDRYLQAMHLGAYDFLRYPFRSGELRWVLRQILQLPAARILPR